MYFQKVFWGFFFPFKLMWQLTGIVVKAQHWGQISAELLTTWKHLANININRSLLLEYDSRIESWNQ